MLRKIVNGFLPRASEFFAPGANSSADTALARRAMENFPSPAKPVFMRLARRWRKNPHAPRRKKFPARAARKIRATSSRR